MSEPDDELMSLARLGIDAEAFMGTKLGRFLHQKATDEILEATSELIAADPADAKANTDIRNKIHVANMFLVWMRESINVGHAAHDQLRALDE